MSAFLRSDQDQAPFPPAGAPKGSARATAAVAGDSTLTFTGLDEQTDYVAYAVVAAKARYVSFRTTGVERSLTVAPNYHAGVSGTVNVPAGERVVEIACLAGSSGGGLVIAGGDAIPMPAGVPFSWDLQDPGRTLVAVPELVGPLTIVFDSTVSFFVGVRR